MSIFKLTERQLIMLGLLIAISVALVAFSAFITGGASLAWGNIRSAIAGVPIKLAGFFFGPFYGMLSGFIADILGNLLVPGNYNFGYTINLMIEGLIPGIIGYFVRKYKTKQWVNYVAFFSFMFIEVTLFIIFLNPLADWIIAGIPSGSSSLLVSNTKIIIWAFIIQEIILALIVGLFWIFTIKKPNKYSYWLPVIALFVAMEDLIILFTTPLWDQMSLSLDYSYLLGSELLYFPIKSVFNVLILLACFFVISKKFNEEDWHTKHY